MKKFTIFAIVVILITLIVVPFEYSYGTGSKKQTVVETNTDEFIEIENEEITLNDKIQVVINIDKIEYQKFMIQIISDLNNVEVEEDDVNMQENGNAIEIEIDKSQTTLNKITLNYELIEDIQVGDKIKISAIVTDLENEDESKTLEKEAIIVEEKIENEDISSDEQKQNKQLNNIKQESQEKIVEIASNQVSGNSKNTTSSQSSGSSKTSSSKSSESTVTYNGSDNNYLSSITVDGYELTKEFSKENETYFVKVSEDVQNIVINAVAEDSNSTISIYGNENLKSGSNKILINVTAENGNVKTYRIYVTK